MQLAVQHKFLWNLNSISGNNTRAINHMRKYEMPKHRSVEALMATIAREFDKLPKQLQNVARYVEQQRTTLMMRRISEIADGCGVHSSAVVRFAQRFGFSGFSEMQNLFRHEYADQATPAHSYQQRIRQVIQNDAIPKTSAQMALHFIEASRVGLTELASGLDAERFQAAVDLLIGADNIYIAGMRRSFSIASYITYALQHTRKRAFLVSDLGGMHREQIQSIGRNDVLIAISFPPYASETLHCIQVAKQKKAKVLAITESELGPLANDADILLKVQEGSAFAFRALTSTICLCQALFVALAYELELHVEETRSSGAHDD